MVFVERKTHRESWKGEESVKDRITLPKSKIVDFLDGSYTLDMAIREGKVTILAFSRSCLLRGTISVCDFQKATWGMHDRQKEKK